MLSSYFFKIKNKFHSLQISKASPKKIEVGHYTSKTETETETEKAKHIKMKQDPGIHYFFLHEGDL